MKFKKLFDPEPFCILHPDYYKIVMESASQWAQLPYDTKSAQPSWYKKNIFTKEEGYIMTGFKMDWQANQPSTGNEMLDWGRMAPIQMLFVPEALYQQIRNIKTQGCKVLASAYGSAKIMHAEYRVVPIFCLMVSEVLTELTEKDVRNIESVDAVVGGV